MSNPISRRVCMLIAAATILPSSLIADSPASSTAPAATPSRVVIRGSGNDVRLERDGSPPVPRRQFAPARTTFLDEIARMSKSGVADPVLITYMKTHAREIPKVINQDDLDRLQRGGASETVVSYLTRTAAVDIGLSGEGHEVPVYAGGPGPYGYSPALYSDDMGNGYPGDYPVYGSGYYAGALVRRHFHQMNHPQPVPIVHPRPGLNPMRPMGTHTVGAISGGRRPDGF
jgi:hypothetical protein